MKAHARFTLVCLLVFLTCFTASCSPNPPAAPTQADLPNLPSSTPTPTPSVFPGLNTPAPTAPPAAPTRGEIELRFTDPGTLQECQAHFPFEISGEAGQQQISGGGVIDCEFSIQQCGDGVCVTYHSEYFMDSSLSGIVLTITESYPDGALDAGLAGTFTMKQYWTDIPPETIMAFTEANPFEVESSDILPLFFHFRDGATCEIAGAEGAFPWVFTLHLE